MAQLLTDGDFTTAQPISTIRYSAPFMQYGINNLYVLEQDFCIRDVNFASLAIDSPHPTAVGFYLAAETPFQPASLKNIVTWTRRYAQVPSSFSRNGGTYGYTFPAILTGVTNTSRLAPFNFGVASRVQTDFFHVSDPTTITIIEPQRYVLSTAPLSDATSANGQPVVTNGAAFIATIPDQPTYSGWIAGGIELVPEASKVTPNWMGNIHMRETIYLKAH